MKIKYVDNFNRITKKYINDLTCKKYKPLPIEREKLLIDKIKKGDDKAKNLLIEAHLRLVVTIAKRYYNKGLDMADLIQEGNLGLFEALNRFDSNKNVRFCVYASWWVSKYIRMALNINTEINNNEIIFDITNDEDNESNNEDKYCIRTRCNEEKGYESNVEDCNEGKDCCMEIIENLLSTLDKRMRFIIESFYGINGKKQMSLVEIGNTLGISHERARQLKNKGMILLRSNAMSLSLSSEILDTINIYK